MRSRTSANCRCAAVTELSSEGRLVLACARLAPSHEQISRLASDGIDWDAAVRLGVRHGLGPLMHRHLSQPGIALPRPAAAALWARAEWVAQRNRWRSAELVAVAQELRAHGIRFLPFKGPTLGRRVYGDSSLREFNDLDLLVGAAEVATAGSILARRGYAPRTPIDASREELWLRSGGCHELAFANERGDLIELQWRANPDFSIPRLDDPAWWASAPVYRFDGVDVSVMPAEEEMLALLVHGAKHSWASMDWLVDVAELARAGRVPWDRVIALARDQGAARRAALGLWLVRELLDAPLPDFVLQFTQLARVEAIAGRVVESLFAAEHATRSPMQVVADELALCDSWPRRVARAAQIARPTPGDWRWLRLPRALAFLYWGLRPVRLAAKYLIRSPRTRAAATPRTPPPQPRSTG
jgi:hypothetical protein